METVGAAGSAAVAAVGMEHARLSYHYLDRGDVDGYASLFAQDAVLRHPGRPAERGATAIERTLAHRRRSGERHVLDTVFAADNRVAAVGRLTDDRIDVGFVDIFAVTPSGLLVARDRYYFTEPR